MFETTWQQDALTSDVPGILSEIKYETDWLLKMQDHKNGSVYKGILTKISSDDKTENPSSQMILQNEDIETTGSFC